MQGTNNYAIAPITEKPLRARLLYSAHHWLSRGCTREDIATVLKLEISFYAARISKNREWRGNPEAEKAIREAPENQEWIGALIQEAIEAALAVENEIQQRMNG